MLAGHVHSTRVAVGCTETTTPAFCVVSDTQIEKPYIIFDPVVVMAMVYTWL